MEKKEISKRTKSMNPFGKYLLRYGVGLLTIGGGLLYGMDLRILAVIAFGKAMFMKLMDGLKIQLILKIFYLVSLEVETIFG